MKNLNGRVAAITGAASGIGRALALELTYKGCKVALADINEEGLQETAKLVAQAGGKASTHNVDVSQAEQIEAFAQEAIAAHGAVHILINNAGLTFTGSLLHHDDATWDKLIGVNLMGVVYGCRTFIPHLLTHDEAHIVNISSLFGIVGIPGQTAYCATKFAVRGVSECLWGELSNTSVQVTVVHPGGIATNIAANSGFKDAALKEHSIRVFKKTMPPRIAAAQIVRAIQRNRQRLIITGPAKIGDLVKRLMPVRGVGWAAKSLRKALRLQPYESSVLIASSDDL